MFQIFCQTATILILPLSSCRICRNRHTDELSNIGQETITIDSRDILSETANQQEGSSKSSPCVISWNKTSYSYLFAYDGLNCLNKVEIPVTIGQPSIGYPSLTFDRDSNEAS